MRNLRTYEHTHATVAVTSDRPSDLLWLDEFLTPAFRPSENRDADLHVALTTNPALYAAALSARPNGQVPTTPCFALDRSVESYPHWPLEDRTVVENTRLGVLYVRDGLHVDVLPHPTSNRLRFGAMLVCREFASACAQSDPQRMQLHAAALARGESAVLIAGPKRAGKTTLLIHLASSPGSRILANDRALVSLSEGGIEVRGIPTLVRVRPDTLALMPALLRRVSWPPDAAHRTMAEAESASSAVASDPPSPLKLSPTQFAHALGSSLAGQAALGAIAFPERHVSQEGLSVDRVDPAESERRLLDARFGLRAGRTGPSLFERMVGASREDGADAALIARLAAATPGYVVRIGKRALARRAAAATALEALLPPRVVRG